MYQPPHFREDRLDVQHKLIVAHPLGLIVSIGPEGLIANPLPFLLDPQVAPFGKLRSHLARANSQWQNLDGQAVLVVFQGVNTYVSPSWYQTKQDTGKVVPTWNYAIVQARGIAHVLDDRSWLSKQVGQLTTEHEAKQPIPWAVGDAPADYISAQLKGIVGLEIAITSIEGKWKVSQNRPEADRRGVAEALENNDTNEMARLVRTYGHLD
jgi:transcriptional regulator